jgi:hypothetical protein
MMVKKLVGYQVMVTDNNKASKVLWLEPMPLVKVLRLLDLFKARGAHSAVIIKADYMVQSDEPMLLTSKLVKAA